MKHRKSVLARAPQSKKPRGSRRWRRFVLISAAMTLPIGAPVNAAALEIKTNEAVIENLLKQSDLDITNPRAVFNAVLTGLPAKVTVYPTENYYYFYFTHAGSNYTGNIRFDAADQFDGKVHFAYFREYTHWEKPEAPIYRKFGAADGVTVEQLGRLDYRVSSGGHSVAFSMVDLSGVKPPREKLLPDETYIGPVWDESGVQFYLVFNRPSKTFLYVLHEEAAATDRYTKSSFSDDIMIGSRTSFAYIRDAKAPRHILIGVFVGNTEVNNMFDGPFDQIPDNFIEGEALRNALLEIEPGMKGKIDRYGSLPDGSERYAITTYVYYDFPEDLRSVAECARPEKSPAEYYACFNGERPGEKSAVPPQRTDSAQ
jgi:hypothetical protein